MTKTNNRTREFQKNNSLEEVLQRLSSSLSVCEGAYDVSSVSSCPIVFIIGAPRSGTTILMQWLSQLEGFAYPSNLLSRFYSAPFVGCLVQEMLCNPDCDYRSELIDVRPDEVKYESSAGKTLGALSPNEFWYWWRRFIPNIESRLLSAEEEALIDVTGFQRSYAAMQSIINKPFATKGIILQYNMKKLLEIFPNALFLHTRRVDFYNIQSLLLTREKFHGDRNQWFSVKPPQYEKLVNLTPEQQVAGQVYLTNQSIEEQARQLPGANYLRVSHEEFCRSPKSVHGQLCDKLKLLGYEGLSEYQGAESFVVHNQNRLSEDETNRVKLAQEFISTEF